MNQIIVISFFEELFLYPSEGILYRPITAYNPLISHVVNILFSLRGDIQAFQTVGQKYAELCNIQYLSGLRRSCYLVNYSPSWDFSNHYCVLILCTGNVELDEIIAYLIAKRIFLLCVVTVKQIWWHNFDSGMFLNMNAVSLILSKDV